MDADSALILAGCGLLAVVGGLLVLGAFIMYRLLRVNIFSTFMGWFLRGSGDEDRTPEQPYSAQLSTHRRSEELRAKADAVSFDEAVAQYQNKENPAANAFIPMGVDIPPQQDPADPLADDNNSGKSLPPANRPLRRRRGDNSQQDELFGGKLDEDGDGTIDF